MTQALRVLQVLGSSAGGVARHVADITAALSEPAPGGPGALVRVAGPSSVEQVVDRGGQGPAVDRVEITDRPRPGDLVAVARLRRLSSGADVVHAHGLRAGALAVLAVRTLAPHRRPRLVVTLHNIPVGGRAVRAVSGALERVVARGADVVLGVSGDIVARTAGLGAHVSERALVPAPVTAPPARSVAEVRAELDLAPSTRLVVTVARLAPQKGLDVLADAAALLASDTDLLWVLAGDGPLEPVLTARVRDDRLPVRLLGRRGDVPDLLAAADVVVSTAVWEGQPIAVQEALRLGAAVVATDAGGTREVTGDAAVLVPVGAAAALAEAVRALLTDDERRAGLAAAALARSAQLPTSADVVDQLLEAYGVQRTH